MARCYNTLVDQVKQGTVPESEVDRPFRGCCRKFRLGLFDNPYVDPDYAEKTQQQPGAQKLAAGSGAQSDRAAEE